MVSIFSMGKNACKYPTTLKLRALQKSTDTLGLLSMSNFYKIFLIAIYDSLLAFFVKPSKDMAGPTSSYPLSLGLFQDGLEVTLNWVATILNKVPGDSGLIKATAPTLSKLAAARESPLDQFDYSKPIRFVIVHLGHRSLGTRYGCRELYGEIVTSIVTSRPGFRAIANMAGMGNDGIRRARRQFKLTFDYSTLLRCSDIAIRLGSMIHRVAAGVLLGVGMIPDDVVFTCKGQALFDTLRLDIGTMLMVGQAEPITIGLGIKGGQASFGSIWQHVPMYQSGYLGTNETATPSTFIALHIQLVKSERTPRA
ncbi:hypothetical protein VM1G_12086 [Cytospora mali]|uniref:Uncharacterized protein n=1 Tax=Cytospora mali TaxID=578113 RepID=A0A194VKD3_CYTMA|nr:hypothetical protein VM1G_12086 [Valsa mali]